MNTDTREVRDLKDITPAEMATGKWVKVPKGYTPKNPATDEDYRRIMAADARRKLRAAKRLAAAPSSPEKS
ncbi:MAG: hypothetical protein ACR652_24520 [Methylocystis sp.]|uniref:hypothetical protein n=1 Tax=Methylocystis sp. TaxID=1911079 RepID=UPI003DA22697